MDRLDQQHRKIKVYTSKMQQLSKQDFRHVLRTPKEEPVITRETLNDTLAIAKMFPNRQQLLDYYSPRKIDESGQLVQLHSCKNNHESIRIKLRRRQQWREILSTNETVELEKYPQRQANIVDCQVPVEHRSELHKLGCKELKKQLRKHSLKVSGKKKELIQTLKTHIETFHSLN